MPSELPLFTWLELLIQKWPDLVITMVGVFVGAFLAYWAESARARRQEKREERAEAQRNQRRLAAYLDRAKFELRENEHTIKQILEKLGRIRHPRVDLFRWVAALSKSLSVGAYDDLARSGLQGLLSEELQSDLFAARQTTVGLMSMLEAGEPAIQFYYGYSADQAGADLVLDNMRTYAQTAQEVIAEVKEAAFAETDGLKQKLAMG